MEYQKSRDEFKCCECGKTFICHDATQWVYARSRRKEHTARKLFCSWSCMRKYDKEKELKKKRASNT